MNTLLPRSFIIFVLLIISISIISCKDDKSSTETKNLPVPKPVIEKKYKLKLGTMYLYSTSTISAYWEFTNNSSDYIDQINFDAYYSCCANSAFGIKFKNIGPGKTVKTEDLLKGSGRLNMIDIKSVDLTLVRFMVNGKHDSDAKEKIEILPNKYDRKITLK